MTPGIVPALNYCVRAFTKPGDPVILQTPVYHPFYYADREQRPPRRPQSAPVRRPALHDGPRRPPDEDRRPRPDAHPLQPPQSRRPGLDAGGARGPRPDRRRARPPRRRRRDPPRPRLPRPSPSCLRRARPGAGPADDHLHRPEQDLQHAGLATAAVVAANPDLHKRFEDEEERSGFDLGNALGIVAFEAAYRHGEDWLDELLPYLEANVDLIEALPRGAAPGDQAHPARRDLSGPPRLPRPRPRARRPQRLLPAKGRASISATAGSSATRRRASSASTSAVPGPSSSRPWSGSSGRVKRVKPRFS